MSRRRLEAAILAGKEIGEGKEWPSHFEKVELIKEVPFKYDRDGVYSLQFSLEGDLLAVGYGNGGIELLDATTGESAQNLQRSKYGGLPVTCIRFHPKEHSMFFAGTALGVVSAYNTADGSHKEIIVENDNEINCLDFSLNGSSFATGGKDLDVRIYDTDTQQIVRQYCGYHENTPHSDVTQGHAMRIFALRFHPENNHIFITGGWDNHLKIWDARSSDGVKRTIHGPHICGDSLDIKGFKILTGSWAAKHSLQVWDYSEGKLEHDVEFPDEGRGAFLYCAQFCDNNVVLAGGSGTNSAKAINVDTNECLGTIKMTRPVQAMDTTQGGRIIAVGGADHFLQISKLT